jgi:2-haloacid dehalogenase
VPVASVIVFDVNETLSDLGPMDERFVDIGLTAPLATTWFAQVLRYGFALAAAGGSARFATIADGVLRTMFGTTPPNRAADDAVRHVLEGFSSLQVHPDVPDGVRALTTGGLRLATLSNGAASVAEALLTTAGVRGEFERLLSVDDAGRWKPAPESYAYAARECGVDPAEMVLVAVHPWDIDGAARAGLRTAWIDRSAAAPYPSHLTAPDITVSGVDDLARALSGGGLPPRG